MANRESDREYYQEDFDYGIENHQIYQYDIDDVSHVDKRWFKYKTFKGLLTIIDYLLQVKYQIHRNIMVNYKIMTQGILNVY